QERRHLERDPAVDAGCPVPDRSEQVCRPGEVFESQVEEELFRGLALLAALPYGGVVRGALADGVVEDRGVRGEPRDREVLDVPGECPALEQVTGDVVEPERLAEVVELLRGFGYGHGVPLGWVGGLNSANAVPPANPLRVP